MHNVTIVQRILPHYRVSFFTQLQSLLAQHGVALNLIYGQELPGTVPKSVKINAPWAREIENLYISLRSANLVWQPCTDKLAGSDLVIVEQANSLLLNYWLMLKRRSAEFKLAYWGHGRNFQASDANTRCEAWKRRLISVADWWFAYTDATLPYLKSAGFSDKRITVVENSFDTSELQREVQSLSDEKVEVLRQELGLRSDRVAIFCGGLHAGKRIDFMLEACREVRARLSDFEMIVIGDGPMQDAVAAAALRYPWLHYVGPRFGTERLPYFALAQIVLMPGPVGLAVIDSFVTGIPLITTKASYHGPEIAYLSHGVNGVLVDNSLPAYVDAVVAYLSRPDRCHHLVEGCKQSAARYSIENMVARYAAGIKDCLQV